MTPRAPSARRSGQKDKDMNKPDLLAGTRISQPRFDLILVAAVLSLAMLAYELLLTRIASVLLTNQYVFLILGVALLGISAGAILDYWLVQGQDRRIDLGSGVWLTGSAGVLVLALVLILKVGPYAGLLVLAVSAAMPFAVSGLILSRLFRLAAGLTGILYAADLAGAAAGALIVPFMLSGLGPVQAILALAAMLAAVGALLTLTQFRPVQTALAFVLFFTVAGLLYGNRENTLLGDVPIGKSLDKDLYGLSTLPGSSVEIVESRWSTFGRTDLVRFKNDPSVMAVFIDGAAGADMLRASRGVGGSSPTVGEATRLFGGMVPVHQKGSALIIGPGGGRDVLMALEAGFRNITAVEINPQMVQIVKDYRAFNGGLYTDFKNVRVIVAEGRNFLRHSNEKYDLITLFMPVTKSSRGLSAFALSESYLFTTEAFADYYRHLTDEGGLLIMAHNIPEAIRITTTAAEMLQAQGLTMQQAMSHLYILGCPKMMPLVGLRAKPLSPEESEGLREVVHSAMFDSRYSYIPGVEQQLLRLPIPCSHDAGIPMMNPLFIDLAKGRLPLDRLERGADVNLVPATDDRPFFFWFNFGVPKVVLMVWSLATAVLAAMFFIPGYRLRARLQTEGGRFSWCAPLFFVAIGIGYMVIELALFQRLVFYLGDPSRTLALLLAAVLVGSGIGSFMSRKGQGRLAVLGGALSAVAIMLILVVMPALFSALHNSGPSIQQAMAASILFLQGIPMGLMFPIGLRDVECRLGASAVPWMWAVNGTASVIGSALAIMIAFSAGYAWSLVLGAVCYLAAALFMYSYVAHAPASTRLAGVGIARSTARR